MRGILSTQILDDSALIDRARRAAAMAGADWVQAVKPSCEYSWSQDQGEWRVRRGLARRWAARRRLDCGAKQKYPCET